MNVNYIEGGIFMNYNKPELETLEFEAKDIITVSNPEYSQNGEPSTDTPEHW